MELSDLNCALFLPYVKQPFTLEASPEVKLDVELVSAVEFAAAFNKNGGRKAFCLTLRGPLKPVFPQRIYTLKNEKLGSMDVFVVPVGSDAQGTCYEIQFT